MNADYVIAKENFKEAARHVSPDTDPVMFNLICGLQSLTDQIEADFAVMKSASAPARKPSVKKVSGKPSTRKPPVTKGKKTVKKARRSR